MPPCDAARDTYLDERLNDPSVTMSGLARSLHRQCAGCPVMFECLYRAVVEVDVSGYVACTTEPERTAMRAQLGVEVSQPSLAPFGAPRVGGGPVSHEAVVAARQAHPKDTCQQLAERLGCSTSTIKRHLRRERQKAASPADGAAAEGKPTLEQVLDAFDQLSTAHVA
jgi:hypothetical protein